MIETLKDSITYPFRKINNLYLVSRFKIKTIYWKRQLMRGIEIIRWDIVESSIEILFKQFELFYAKSRMKYNYEDKEFLEELRLTCPRQYEQTLEAHEVSKYVIQRKKNIELFNQELVDCGKQLSISFDDRGVLQFKDMLDYYAKFIFDDYTMSVDYVKMSNSDEFKCWDYTFAEQKLSELDNEWAKRIIDLRRSLWD